MTVAFRPLVDDDRHFVIDAWCRSFQFSHTAGMISVDRWFAVMIPEVERVLARAQTIVAHDPDDTSKLADLQGFITFDVTRPTPVVYYTFVKEPYRRAGYARALFGAAGIDPTQPFVYTCSTGVVSRLYRDRKIPSAKWDPLIPRFAPDDERRPRRSR